MNLREVTERLEGKEESFDNEQDASAQYEYIKTLVEGIQSAIESSNGRELSDLKTQLRESTEKFQDMYVQGEILYEVLTTDPSSKWYRKGKELAGTFEKVKVYSSADSINQYFGKYELFQSLSKEIKNFDQAWNSFIRNHCPKHQISEFRSIFDRLVGNLHLATNYTNWLTNLELELLTKETIEEKIILLRDVFVDLGEALFKLFDNENFHPHFDPELVRDEGLKVRHFNEATGILNGTILKRGRRVFDLQSRVVTPNKHSIFYKGINIGFTIGYRFNRLVSALDSAKRAIFEKYPSVDSELTIPESTYALSLTCNYIDHDSLSEVATGFLFRKNDNGELEEPEECKYLRIGLTLTFSKPSDKREVQFDDIVLSTAFPVAK
jgi:hypothetical protein